MPTQWSYLMSAFKKYRRQVEARETDPFFMTYDVFEKTFRGERSIDSSKIRSAFRFFDGNNRGRISSTQVFAGLALVLDAQLVVKFKCTKRVLDDGDV